ncbi:hypothetical protein JQ615_09615 [Bradyrhizobium jicamae]|uniref:Uncharacterized protein n=1 Tax=Bradyrhizobium jicamae TaxID=280332 RepID=A0ABS5FFT8_9BRAD|nr:hypothetical protein [Bradyrhizobium jicamae]MBR0795644.1 hypothetical protein [Bradyrhizobium jicamae]
MEYDTLARSLVPSQIEGLHNWIVRKGRFHERNYHLNFMFKQLPSNEKAIKAMMRDEVERVYSILLTREVRRPHSPLAERQMPVFVGCPDLPVPKRDKATRRLVVANDGWHFNGVLVLSSFSRGKFDPEIDFERLRHVFCPTERRLERIWPTRIEYGSMADYTMKALKNGRVDWDDILVLPRSQSEF